MKPPRWECRDEADQKRLEEFTNYCLDEIDRKEFEAFDPAVEFAHDEPLYETAAKPWTSPPARWAGLYLEYLSNSPILKAIEDRDIKTLVRLTDTEERRRFAFQVIFKRRKRGREKGDPRPSDISDVDKSVFENAIRQEEIIRFTIWKRHYNKTYRGQKYQPTATQIAARRNGAKPEELINYKKNRNRKERRTLRPR